MKRLYVAGQNAVSREWIPIAELREVSDGFELRYTRGAQRLPGFSGLGRMQALDKVYHSRALFPFFANRLISKSRPDYYQYLRWIGLDGSPTAPLDMLGVTGGVRATDSYELIALPRQVGQTLELDFFPRGLRYQSAATIAQLVELNELDRVFLLKDVQNEKHPAALAIRTERPHVLMVGYVPRYYCVGLNRLLDGVGTRVEAQIKRVNKDAPMDMKLLISIRATIPKGFDVLADVEDFLPLNAALSEELSLEAISRTDLNI